MRKGEANQKREMVLNILRRYAREGRITGEQHGELKGIVLEGEDLNRVCRRLGELAVVVDGKESEV